MSVVTRVVSAKPLTPGRVPPSIFTVTKKGTSKPIRAKNKREEKFKFKHNRRKGEKSQTTLRQNSLLNDAGGEPVSIYAYNLSTFMAGDARTGCGPRGWFPALRCFIVQFETGPHQLIRPDAAHHPQRVEQRVHGMLLAARAQRGVGLPCERGDMKRLYIFEEFRTSITACKQKREK